MPRNPVRSVVLFTVAALFFSFRSDAAQPQIVSVSPSSGSGQTETFTLTVSDSAGAADISSIDMLVNSAFDKTNACWLFFDHRSKLMEVASDQGGWFSSEIGYGGTQQNSQCSVQFVSSADSGNNASFTVTITFSSAWLGAKTIWAESLDLAKNDSAYQQVGTYTAVHSGPTQDFSVSITPSHLDTTPGHTVAFNYTITSINGFAGNVGVTATANPQPSGMVVFPSLGSSRSLPANGTATGQIMAVTSTSTPPTNNVTITVVFQDANLQHTAQVTLNIASPATPFVSVSPSSGSGPTQTFVISATDPGGFTAIGQMNFLISSSFDGTNACWFYYQPGPDPNTAAPSGNLTLANNDGSWSGSNSTNVGSDPNSVTPIFNSQCSVFGGPTTVSGSGDTLTLNLTLTFTSSFVGQKVMFLRAADAGGPDSGYQQVGTFTTAAGTSGPDFSIAVTPASQSVTGQSRAVYSVIVKDVNGFAGTVNPSVTGIPPNSTLTPPASIAPNQWSFAVNTTGTTPTGAYTLTVTGTSGALSHSQSAVLNVQAAPLPVLTSSPDSGSGTTQAFAFVAMEPDSASITDMNILFNTTVDGSHACWIYAGQHGISLASDDGTLWLAVDSNHTMQNSQCTVVVSPTTDPAAAASLNATITFSGSFSGTKNIFMHAANTEGGDTGYQLQGSWTVP
jgi:hypothetical protein